MLIVLKVSRNIRLIVRRCNRNWFCPRNQFRRHSKPRSVSCGAVVVFTASVRAQPLQDRAELTVQHDVDLAALRTRCQRPALDQRSDRFAARAMWSHRVIQRGNGTPTGPIFARFSIGGTPGRAGGFTFMRLSSGWA